MDEVRIKEIDEEINSIEQNEHSPMYLEERKIELDKEYNKVDNKIN